MDGGDGLREEGVPLLADGDALRRALWEALA
jgi:hypothetical protein